MAITIYGIKNCDTMKKAFAWFDGAGVACTFHDYKKSGIDAATLTRWCEQLGWETLVNKRGTTWRKLTPDQQAIPDTAAAIALMQGSEFEVAAKPMLQLPDVIRCFLLDQEGRQQGRNLNSGRNNIGDSLRFSPLEDTTGAVWSRRAYFQHAIDQPGVLYMSEPYLSMTDTRICVTLSMAIEIDEERVVTSTGAIKLKEVPKRLLVIGAGIIGLELGSVWGRLGAQVTVVEYLDRILPGLDSEAARQMHRMLQKQGMEFRLGHKVKGIDKNPWLAFFGPKGLPPEFVDRFSRAVTHKRLQPLTDLVGGAEHLFAQFLERLDAFDPALPLDPPRRRRGGFSELDRKIDQ